MRRALVAARRTDPQDHYSRVYGDFDAPLYAEIRREAFGEDVGQSGWSTAAEQRRIVAWLDLTPADRVLDVGCGSGGPLVHLAREAGCRGIGIDTNAAGVAHGNELADRMGIADRVRFELFDAGQTLPSPAASFGAVVCLDVVTHLTDRKGALAEWARVLEPGGRLLFTDSAVVTGLVSDAEIAARSRLGACVFAAPGEDARLVATAGLELRTSEDVTATMAAVAGRRWRARAARTEALRAIEGDARYQAHQDVLRVAEALALERRLSRYVFLAVKP